MWKCCYLSRFCLLIPKAQFKKTDFVNSRTAKAYHSLKDWGKRKSALRNLSLTILSHKKAPKENTYFSTFQPKKPQKSMPCFLAFSISKVPRIQKTNKQNIILLVFQKTSASLLPVDTGHRLLLPSTDCGPCDLGLWCRAFRNQNVNPCGMNVNNK